ncbi:MAG: hypothetical protein DRP47_12615, partial [Candidatus Zixiibacteriota bacterium]
MRENFGPLKHRFFILAVAVAVVMVAGSVTAQIPELIIRMHDTTVTTADDEGMLLISMDNYVDTVAGFALWLMTDRPDVIAFQMESSTIIDTFYWQCLAWSGPDCIDSLMVPEYEEWDWFTIDTNEINVAAFDTTGTLISGWQYVEARSLGGLGYDINVVGIANMISPPYIPGVPPHPQQGGTLIKIPFDILADPVDPEGEIANVLIARPMDHFGFARPDGTTIGIVYDSILDTTCFVCTQWADEVCLNWVVSPGPDCDSIWVDTVVVPVLDTNVVKIFDGMVTVLPDCIPIPPGDVDGDGFYDISELVMLIDYIR